MVVSISTIYEMYFEALVILAITILYLIRVIRRRPIITLTDAFGEKKERYQKRVNWVVKVILGVMLIWIDVLETLPMVLDLPYVIKNEYKTIEGYTTSRSMGNGDVEWYKRNFDIKNKDEEIHAYTYRVEVGVYMEVNYLPNSHYVTVIYRSDKPDE